MKQIIKKVLSICMISTLVLSMLLSSLQRVSADESENIPNSPIKVLEENISDESIDNIDNKTLTWSKRWGH
ncbi:MAG: hypothetical protein ACLU4L_04145 [Anaerostipes sp.]|jgi:hypothetical protein|uniref:hypothetical protein n=1 Tax=Anaerostipes sp. TaxID=1872530 RepID=UPI0020979E44|nr:hypothetical protein [Anaerostipes hadrus]